MGRRLYVGNLPYSATEEQLTELFGRAGKVDNVRVMRDMATGRSPRAGSAEAGVADVAVAAVAAAATAAVVAAAETTAAAAGSANRAGSLRFGRQKSDERMKRPTRIAGRPFVLRPGFSLFRI